MDFNEGYVCKFIYIYIYICINLVPALKGRYCKKLFLEINVLKSISLYSGHIDMHNLDKSLRLVAGSTVDSVNLKVLSQRMEKVM
jgi:hypothetical protein